MHEITPSCLRECTQVDACPKISCIVCSSHHTWASVRMLSRTSERADVGYNSALLQRIVCAAIRLHCAPECIDTCAHARAHTQCRHARKHVSA